VVYFFNSYFKCFFYDASEFSVCSFCVDSSMHRRVRKLRLYIVSTCLWEIWCQTPCHMFNVTHRNEFVTQKVCRHPSFSVWKRLIVDTLRGNMSVEHKHKKLCNKLYTDTCSHEKIFMRTHPCNSKSCAEGRLFTVNTHHSPSCGSNQCSQTWFRMWKVAYREGFVS